MLNYVALDQTLREMKAHMAVSIMLQILGFSQDEIGGWFDYTQQGISYHANVAKREMERG